MSRRRNLLGTCGECVGIMPSNQIWYTTTDGSMVTPTTQNAFGVNIVSNIYNGDNGIITFDGELTTIGNGAFGGCSSLTSVTIPDSVTTIGGYAFAECSSLTSVTIVDSITTIGEMAFYYCSSLTSVTIPDSVTTIGYEAFYKCTNLTSVYCKATTPPTLASSAVFESNKSDRKIYVPAESVEAYKAARNWSEYAADIVGYDF